MVQLVTLEQVSDRMGVGEVPPATPVLTSALNAAHLRIAAELDTKFDRLQAQQEVFYLDDVKHNGIVPEGFFRLRLRNGFVRASPAVAVYAFDNLDQINTGLPGEDITARCQVNRERGFVFVPGTDRSYPSQYTSWPYPVQAGGPQTANVLHPSWFNGKFIRVTYDSGFVDATEAPEALIEAILAYVSVVVDFSALTGSTKADRPYQAAGDHALAVLTPLRRRLALSYDPVY